MKYNNKNGFVLSVIIIIIGLLFVIYFIVSQSWAMSLSRTRYENTLYNAKAYYMARSGMEQIILKLDTMKKYCHEAILNLEKAPVSERNYLFSVFMEDIIIPPHDDYKKNEKLEYSVNEFNIFYIDTKNSTLTFEIKVTGKYSGFESSIKRLISISR